MGIHLPKELQLWPVTKLVPYERNARTHSDEQVDQIAASIKEFGFTNPLLVDSKNGIIAGHGRLMAAKKLGLEQVPVIVLDNLSDAQRRAYIIADNKLALNAGWDLSLLSKEIEQLDVDRFDLDLLGFSDEELADLMPEVEEHSPGEADEVPDALPEPKVVRGEIYVLGQHRLMCGDSTSIDDVEKLMNGEKADMVFTDPPYNIDYSPEERGQGGRSENNALGRIKNDSMSTGDFEQFLTDVYGCIDAVLKEGRGIYLCSPIGFELKEYLDAWEKFSWKYQTGLVWAKNNHSISRFDFHPKHEIIHYGWKEGAAHYWAGARNLFSVINVDRENGQEYVHPTQKPVALPVLAIENSSKRNEIVLDLFGGSGSTLIAADTTSRAARVMELDPKFCQVILDRWQKFTGKKAHREDGVPWDEIRGS